MHIYEIEKNGTEEPIFRARNRVVDAENRCVDTEGGVGRRER